MCLHPDAFKVIDGRTQRGNDAMTEENIPVSNVFFQRLLTPLSKAVSLVFITLDQHIVLCIDIYRLGEINQILLLITMTQIYEKTDIDGSESGQTFFCL